MSNIAKKICFYVFAVAFFALSIWLSMSGLDDLAMMNLIIFNIWLVGGWSLPAD